MLDPALDTLLLPFETGALTWPKIGPILFLRARFNAALMALDIPHERFICWQPFQPFARDLTRAKLTINPELKDFPKAVALTLVLAPRQRDEARYLLAQAITKTCPGGLVVIAATNTEGARSIEADCAELTGNVTSLSKNKSRVFWAEIKTEHIDQTLLQNWLELGEERPLDEDARFLTQPGLFAWDRIDAGSALLARHLPNDLSGIGADLGCGFGYLSAELLRQCPKVTQLDLYEAEAVALNLAAQNLKPLTHDVEINFLWHDVTEGLTGSYDFIVSNPPFHIGRKARSDLGQAFIIAGTKALKPGGRMFIVANQHLPYEMTIAAQKMSSRLVNTANGYKIIEVTNNAPVSLP